MCLHNKLISLALCLCMLMACVAEHATAAEQIDFAGSVQKGWELARDGRHDEALTVLAACRRRTTDPVQLKKIDSMTTVYTMMRARARQKMAGTPGRSAPPGAHTPAETTDSPDASSAPSLGGLRAPEYHAEHDDGWFDLPDFSWPKIRLWPRGGFGKYMRMPDWSWPRLRLPRMRMPDVHMSDLKMPAMRMPSMDWGVELHAPDTVPGDWEMSLAPVMRTVGTVEFAPRALARPDGGQYINGRHTDAANFRIEGDPADAASANPANPAAQENVSPQLDLTGWQTVDPDGTPGSGDEAYVRNVYFDSSAMDTADMDMDGARGLLLQATRHLEKRPLLPSSLTLGLGLTRNRAKTTVTNGSGITTTTLTGVLSRDGGTEPSSNRPVTPYQEASGSVEQGGPTNFDMTQNLFDMGGPNTTDVRAKLEAESTMLTLSLGLQYEVCVTRWLSLIAGGGPTVNVFYAESTISQDATWNAPTSSLDGDPVPNFSDEQSESVFDVQAGAYAILGARFRIMPRLSLDLGMRYDRLFGTIATEHADFDLDGVGADFRLTYTF